MSGGFFRGTSADQDTRFSNKQAKLLKSQKFAPELEQLVDITKVKMDVMRPWIATRVTELLGFEDEVLINFIYGLLEGRVDGKQVQIQLTGFMEKNTGKFMKELWNLLLSAQKNASGVPQQFLDAKEEELKKKNVETDRLAQEVQRRKERGGWGPEPNRKSRMDDKEHIKEAGDLSRNMSSREDSSRKLSREDDIHATLNDSSEAGGRHTSRRKNRHSVSPHSVGGSPPSPRRMPLAHKSSSRSVSHSRSYSGGSSKSRSVSISPRRQRRSVSREKQDRFSQRRSISPRRPRSPLRKHSPYSRRRSISHSRHRSPSLPRRRSPIRRRSRSPLRRRSPARYRSPSPRRHPSRSPPRRRSPAYIRRRSPSPLRRRSPARNRSPLRRASPSLLKRVSPTPRSPKGRRSPLPSPRRIYSPRRSRSPMYRPHRSPGRNTGMGLNRARDDHRSQMSPARHLSERDETGVTGVGQKRDDLVANRKPTASKSPRRDIRDRQDTRNALALKSVLLEKPASPINGLEKKLRKPRDQSVSLSPDRPSRNEKIAADGTETIRDRVESRHARGYIFSKDNNSRSRNWHSTHDGDSAELHDARGLSPDGHRKPRRAYGHLKGKSCASPSPGHTQEATHFNDDIEYGPGRVEDDSISAGFSCVVQDSTKGGASPYGRRKAYGGTSLKNASQKDGMGFAVKHEINSDVGNIPPEKSKQVERNNMGHDSDCEDNREKKSRTMVKMVTSEKDRDASTDEAGYDSQIDELKERKRRRKDERKMRKEEKRRRRDERHRRKEERRASKQKNRHSDPGTPSDYEKNCNADDRCNDDARMDLKLSDNDETESVQKKLEIQLREKALESLRAKKAITN